MYPYHAHRRSLLRASIIATAFALLAFSGNAATFEWYNDAASATGTINVDASEEPLIVESVLSDRTGITSGWDGKSFTKTGDGTLVLSGDNTWTGVTQINGGILNVTGTITSDYNRSSSTSPYGNTDKGSRVYITNDAHVKLTGKWDNAWPLYMRDSSQLTISDTGHLIVGGNNTSNGTDIGDTASSDVKITLQDTGKLEVYGNHLNLGAKKGAIATITLSDNSAVYTYATYDRAGSPGLGALDSEGWGNYGNGGTATINIGNNATWVDAKNGVTFGYSGTGTLNLTESGKFTAVNSIYVGGENGDAGSKESTGYININDNGTLTVGKDLYIGAADTAYVVVSEQGSIHAGNITIANDLSGKGIVTLSNQAFINASGTFNNGLDGTGSLLMEHTARLTATDYIQNASSEVTFILGLENKGAADAFITTESMSLAGDMILVASTDFKAMAGDEWNLLDASTISGNFAHVVGFELSAGLEWDFSRLYTDGIVTIVSTAIPEPATSVILVALAMLVITVLRRRKRD